MSTRRFAFAFERRYRLAGLPFGVTPARVWAEVDGPEVEVPELRVRFGPWSLRTALTNVVGSEVTGPFAFAKTAGPAHLSFADRGVTFATTSRQGLCIRFHEPVRAIEPTGRLLHPGATLTVSDPVGLAAALTGPTPGAAS